MIKNYLFQGQKLLFIEKTTSTYQMLHFRKKLLFYKSNITFYALNVTFYVQKLLFKDRNERYFYEQKLLF